MRIIQILACAALLGIVSGCGRPPVDHITRLCHLELPDTGEAIVLSHYDGFFDGWNVAFFYRASVQDDWFGYYLAHDADSWRDVSVELKGQDVVVSRRSGPVACLDTSTLSFRHLLQKCVYPKAGAVTYGREAAKWNLPPPGTK